MRYPACEKIEIIRLVEQSHLSVRETLAKIGAVDTAKDVKRAEALAVAATAQALGNTPTVARGSYIDPRIWRAYERGELLDLSVSPESAIQRLIRG